jgi:hypothetical protein
MTDSGVNDYGFFDKRYGRGPKADCGCERTHGYYRDGDVKHIMCPGKKCGCDSRFGYNSDGEVNHAACPLDK